MTNNRSLASSRIEAVAETQTEDFAELIRIAGLDPQRDLRFADWSGVNFQGADLRGFDFTGARLHECDFTRARIAGARFDQAELGMVEHVATAWRRENPNAPGVVSELANLREAADWDEFVRGWQRAGDAPASDAHLPVGAIFQDAPFGPEMVVLPAGTFVMGSGDGETPVEMLDGSRGDVLSKQEGRKEDEGPPHEVAIPRPFAVGRFAVTFAEWDAAQADPDWQRVTGLEPRKPDDRGWGRGSRPVISVSWDDAQAYAKWLSEKTGKTYRLLSEAEWEYAARAGTQSRYWFGDDDSRLGEHAWFSGNSGGRTHPFGEKPANAWGLHDMHGNVWEWVADCWNASYADKPDSLKVSGAAWATGDGSFRVLRGGSWFSLPQFLRSASRGRSSRYNRSDLNGFRLARTLTP